MQKLLPYLKEFKKECLLGPLFKFIEVIFELLLPTVLAVMINKGIGGHDFALVRKTGGIMAAMAVCGYCSALVCQRMAARASQGFGTNLRAALFDKILGFSFPQLDTFGASTLTTRLTNDVNQLQQFVATMIRLMIRAPFICIGSIVMSFFLDAHLALLLLAATPILALIIWLITKHASPLYAAYQKLLDRLSDVLRENLSGVRVIRAFTKWRDERARFESENGALTNTGYKIGSVSSLFNPLTSLVVNLTVVALLWAGAFRIDAGRLSQGQIIALTNYVTQLLYALSVMSNLIILITKSTAAAARVTEILDMPADAETVSAIPVNEDHSDAPRVEFKNVSFGYYKSRERVLSDVSFAAQKGETIAVIGSTGCGKTTLMALLAGFYRPDKGKILLDGIDGRRLTEESIRKKIAVVQQKTVLFTGTVADNIRFGAPDADMEAVVEAARTAQAEEFIETLPEGYETMVERGGANLSGGQRQRLAIARALLLKPEILILDDASSALDYLTEARLRGAIRNASRDMTVLIVTQRAGVAKSAEHVLVMDDGHIVGYGTHRALLADCPVYRELCASQLSGEEAS